VSSVREATYLGALFSGAAIVVASWVLVGAGYETEGERWLALSAAARAREQRRIAREELTTTTRSAA
jgi:hypothetical protein